MAIAACEAPHAVEIPLEEVARRLPGRPVHSTVWRWATVGFPLPDGTRLHLQARKIGRRWFTTPQAADEFIAELTRRRREAATAPSP
jgi:hypothetical protein